MERVFWLMLGRDGALVKRMMENFQQSNQHSLPEDHRRMVLMVQHMLLFTFTLQILTFVYRLVVTDSINWNSEWCGYPGDDEEMLGGKPVCVVSSHSCGSLASLQLPSEPGAQQVLCLNFQQHIFKIIFHSLAWVSRAFLGLKEALYKLQLFRHKDKQILLCAELVALWNLQGKKVASHALFEWFSSFLFTYSAGYTFILFFPPFRTVSTLPNTVSVNNK